MRWSHGRVAREEALKILVVGGGGREHALAWKVAASARVEAVWVAPGNAGTAAEPKVRNVDVAADDIDGLLGFARRAGIDLTLVGPEQALVAGIADRFEAAGLRIFGPRAAAARLEGSKAYAKGFCERHGIPCARWASFDDPAPARRYVESQALPVVIKADGLAAGKGVVIARTRAEALVAIEQALVGGRYGEAGRVVVVEEFLRGEELSFIAAVGGGQVLALASSQDHKARDDGDRGPNTGGMGACSPAPALDPALRQRIEREIVEPTVRGLAAEGLDYTGFLYAGLMVAPDGTPRVLEFNCRLGDPETQVIIPRLRSDLVELCEAALDGTLARHECQWDERACVGVVLAAAGYPDRVARGQPVGGLDTTLPDAKIFHAGTAVVGGRVVSDGGRILCASALGASLAEAQGRAYRLLAGIDCAGAFHRGDIARRAIEHERRQVASPR